MKTWSRVARPRIWPRPPRSAGASGHGGLLGTAGDATPRCGPSIKGVDIVVRGSVGHTSAVVVQTGSLAVCGDPGSARKLSDFNVDRGTSC